MSPFMRIFFFLITIVSTAFFIVLYKTNEDYTGIHKLVAGSGLGKHSYWKQPKIVTCTVAHGKHKTGYQRALDTHISHGEYHHYETHLLDHSIVPGLWSKEAAILNILLEELSKPKDDQLEWIFWFDADTVVMNKLVPLEIFLPPSNRTDVHLLYTNDWNGLNDGVFLLRVSVWSLEVLSSTLAYRTFRPKEHLEFTEQSALEQVIKMDKYKDGAVKCPPQWFNAYPDDHDDMQLKYLPGQLLVHFAGIGDKTKAVGEWLDKLHANRSDYEIPVAETNYQQQIEDFWRDSEEKHLLKIKAKAEAEAEAKAKEKEKERKKAKLKEQHEKAKAQKAQKEAAKAEASAHKANLTVDTIDNQNKTASETANNTASETANKTDDVWYVHGSKTPTKREIQHAS